MRVPTVHISPAWKYKSMLTVSHDSCITGCVAARELANLGLDNFAFAAAHPMPPWAEKRLSTYSSELAKRGRTASVYDGDNLGAWLRSLPKPCGIFAANDMMAERIVATAKTEGLEVPYDLAVLGCDDDARICEHAETSISSIRPDYTKGGMLTVQMLADVMDGQDAEPVRMFGDTGVIHRASTRLTAYKSPVLSDELEYIRLNAFSGISASDVLSRMKGSRRSAENMFREATGRSILEEIQSVRLNEVKRLLSSSLMKIGAIAAQTGYRSENFLTRLFKRETGMTPSQWRKSPECRW
jgi:LacI family transcriptional regulator